MTSPDTNIILVLDSGRSGASIPAQLLHRFIGLHRPPVDPVTRPGESPPCYDSEISEISREILRHFHRHSWKLSYLPMPEGWLSDPFTLYCKDVLRRLMKQKLALANDQTWIYSDPFTAKLLPLWQSLFKELEIHPLYVLNIRNPADVIQSFVDNYKASENLAKFVWLSRYNDAIEHCRGAFIVCDFDRWFSDPYKQAALLSKPLKLELSDTDINTILSDTIADRPDSTSASLPPDPDTSACVSLYQALLRYQSNQDVSALALENNRVSTHLKLLSDVQTSVDFVASELDRTREKLKTIVTNHRIPTLLDREFMDKRKHLEVISNKIVGGVASFNKRIELFEKVVSSILPQLDILIVFLNNYEEIPDYLNDPKIKVFRSQDYEDLSANGKIFYLDKLKSCYFFSLDDDIGYPSDYVSTMIECMNKYNNQVAVSVHGSILPEQVEWYFERYKLYAFGKARPHDTFVNLIGSGTFAFHTDTLKATFSDFYPNVMVDLRFSILAKQQNIPLVCIARERRWLSPLAKGDGLYQRFLEKRTIHTDEAIQHNPWGFEIFMPAVKRVLDTSLPDLTEESIDLLKLDGDFIEAISSGKLPPNWSETYLYKKKVRHRKVVMDPIKVLIQKNAHVDQLQEKNNKLKEKNTTLQASMAYQIGSILIAAIKKPGKNTILLPYYMTRAIINRSTKKELHNET